MTFSILEAHKPKRVAQVCLTLVSKVVSLMMCGPAAWAVMAVDQRFAAASCWCCSSEVAHVCQTHSCETNAAVKPDTKLKPERVQPGFRVAANGTIPQEKVTVPLWLPLLGWGGGGGLGM